VSIDQAFVDWSGNCGNLSAAVGAYAIHAGLIDNKRLPEQGRVDVRIWQVNIQKTIIVSVPVLQGEVIETGDFELDGVTFPAAELPVTFVDPADGEGKLFPTGNLIDSLDIPELGNIDATLINAGIPTVFIRAQDVNCTGTELQDQINNDPQALALFERIRAIGAVKMGLIQQESEAQQCQHTPKIAFVASATRYQSSSGKTVEVDDIQLLVRALSMGKLHHAMMGTASVAIATAAAVPGTLVNHYAGEGHLSQVCFGHPSGTLTVGASVNQQGEDWLAEQVTMSRSARILMSGEVYLPQ
jgi:probable AcnD-accessory protein PrpF